MPAPINNHHKKKRGNYSRFFLFVPLFALFLFIVFCFSACSDNPVKSTESHYFSLHDFFNSEASELTQAQTQLTKTNALDSGKDSLLISKPDWKKEFELFTNSEINKPAWKSSFFVDTILTDSLLQVNYTAKETSIPIKKVQISFLLSQPTAIHISKETDNFIYSTHQELWYEKKQGFKISGSQKILWFFEKHYEIKGHYSN